MAIRNIFTGLLCLLSVTPGINIIRGTLFFLGGGGGAGVSKKSFFLCAYENVENVEPPLRVLMAKT